MTIEELLEQIRIPIEYAHMEDTPPRGTTDPAVRLEKWRVEVASRLRDLGSHLAISGSLSTEEQSLLVIHVAQHVGNDPWVSNDARSQAEGTCLLPYPSVPEWISHSRTNRHFGELRFTRCTINHPRALQSSTAGLSITHTSQSQPINGTGPQ